MTNELTDRQMLEALYNKFIVEGVEPLPPPGPEPGRPTALVEVFVDKCHLRLINSLDGAGKAVWGSAPRGHDHPKRDRLLIYEGFPVQVYMDGEIKYGIYKGAHKGAGGNHGWEVCPGPTFNRHMVTGDPELYILCRDAKRV